MLTKYDEFLCHQTVSTFDHPGTSAREWTERIWFMAHDTKGDFVLVAGFGYYPNRNVIDGFMCLAVEQKTQHVVRASRELRPRIDEVDVGPFSWHVIEPMKKVRAVLSENEYGVSYDITFDATMPPHDEEPAQFIRSRGRVVEDIRRYFQIGKPSGWIKVSGKTVKVDPQSWRTERDHSWGIRDWLKADHWAMLFAQFGPHFAANVALVVGQGQEVSMGYILRNGISIPVKDVQFAIETGPVSDPPRGARIEVITVDDQNFSIQAAVNSIFPILMSQGQGQLRGYYECSARCTCAQQTGYGMLFVAKALHRDLPSQAANQS